MNEVETVNFVLFSIVSCKANKTKPNQTLMELVAVVMRVTQKRPLLLIMRETADTQEIKAVIMFGHSSNPAASPQGVHTKESGRKGRKPLSVVLDQLHYSI
jgi:hypothetical protein